MAQKVQIFMTDDIDGLSSEGIETVNFSLGKVNYEIDLKPAHRQELEEALEKFIVAARVIKANKTPKAAVRSVRNDETKRIRAWAEEQGFEVAKRGRIHKDIVDLYHQAKAQK